jgi:WD40 repeat protein
LTSGQEVLALKGHTDQVSSVAFSPDGKRVIAASGKGEVRAWDATSGQAILPCTDPPPPHKAKPSAPMANVLSASLMASPSSSRVFCIPGIGSISVCKTRPARTSGICAWSRRHAGTTTPPPCTSTCGHCC